MSTRLMKVCGAMCVAALFLASSPMCAQSKATPQGTNEEQSADAARTPAAERAHAILQEGFASKDYTVRIRAIAAAGMIGQNERILERLENFLHDKKVSVRLAAVHALGDLRTPGCQASLRRTVEEDTTPEVVFAAATVLANWQDAVGIQALRDIYDKKRKSSSGKLRKEERSVAGEFHSLSSGTLFVVAKGIGSVPVPGAGEGFSAIDTLLRDPQLSGRAHVVLLLGKTKNADSLELLRKALTDEDWSVRSAGAQRIAQTAQTTLGDSVATLLEDKNEKVRFTAAGAYLHLLSVGKRA